MVKIGLAVFLLFATIWAFAQKTVLLPGQLGSYNIGLNYSKHAKNVLENIVPVGYDAKIIHMEYLPDSTANVYMLYSVYSKRGRYILSMYEGDSIISKWSIGRRNKTGHIIFPLKQKHECMLTLKVEMMDSSEAEFYDRFSVSTLPKDFRLGGGYPIKKY